ncbi:catalase [Novosphingobium sp. SG751A]|uniref:catalase n=1 Tax=Novosphingobium sp. SG751A TaxID=2587000 RepID=UPI001554D108|nr:catalase [Novosphingobium sp. SG751A]NOW46365.1 catalase [Novosphingobium sp. SG751A]
MADTHPSYETATGDAGETHQQVPVNGPHGNQQDAARSHLTTNQGLRIGDNQNSLKAGARGPTLLEDFVLREKIFHFDHERIPERIVHARGSAAHGVFECTHAIPELTSAGLFAAAGKQTPVFVRFSTVAGGAGSVDTPRDVRGFAVKFYTEEGNWDLVGNNIPVFFIQDAIKFPDLVHAVKMEADKGYPQAASAHDTFWDFVSLMPESIHMVLWQMSDRTIPRSPRFMEGFGIHTFRLVNAEGASKLVKFHWKPVLGLQSTTWDEAVKIAGADPDYHRRDLYEAIDTGAFPAWDLGVQVFEESWAHEQSFDVLDATKLIPEELVPVRIIGRMTLNRNPDNFFAETEQSAFCPANIVPGIDFTPDPLLQGRLFSYLDTQKSRLGTANFHQLPINAPKCPMRNFQRDGMMQMEIPKGRANYEPNSLNEAGEPTGPRECPATGFTSFARGMLPNNSDQHLRVRPALFADHYSQARLFYRSQTPVEQAHLASAFVFELSKVGLEHVRHRMLTLLGAVDEDLARRVAVGLAMELPPPADMAAPIVEMPPSPALSILSHRQPPMEGRKIGILFAEGSSLTAIEAVKTAIESKGGKAVLVAQKVGGIPVDDGMLKAEGQLMGNPSALFDAVASIIHPDALDHLRSDHTVHAWFADAYAHCKTIGACPATLRLLEEWGIARDDGIASLEEFPELAPARHWDREGKVRLLA